MVALIWDKVGEKIFEAGVEKGVLYKQNAQGVYDKGFAWNGLSAVNESPSGAEANKQYANNKVYANITSAEEFSGSLEAFTYPKAFAECDGYAELTDGVTIGQQRRVPFGLSYKTKIGNDIAELDLGYKIHLVYGAKAAPSERNYTTINESPEAMAMSWELTTEPVEVPGKRPTATLVIDSTQVNASKLADLENILYGTAGTEPRLPLPAEVASILGTTLTVTALPTAPTYNSTTKVITIPTITGVDYYIDGVKKANGSTTTITKNTMVTAQPAATYKFPDPSDNDWLITF
ncbi:major tail protein [Arthrobacter phage Tatanka]|uniref:Major tail protein n=1 Tax=Arthrobacter phage Tatanka TaxID=2250368 RepID=A0A2Z5HER6_9CAUD|nr:major tail protein [Arthrobacter phage Tatanka]AXC38641.1 major tail protein [Arthrobacter phage Tatanka]